MINTKLNVFLQTSRFKSYLLMRKNIHLIDDKIYLLIFLKFWNWRGLFETKSLCSNIMLKE